MGGLFTKALEEFGPVRRRRRSTPSGEGARAVPPRARPCARVHDKDRGGRRRDVLLDAAAQSVDLELGDRRGTCCASVPSTRRHDGFYPYHHQFI